MLEEVERQFGTREFKGVHVRVEPDWEQQCAGAQNRTDPSTMLFNNKHQCWVITAPLLIPHARSPCLQVIRVVSLGCTVRAACCEQSHVKDVAGAW